VNGITSRRLREATPVSRAISIAIGDQRIRVAFDDTTFDTRPDDEAHLPVPIDPRSTMRIHQSIRAGALQQVFTTDEGRRWNTLRPSPDGRSLALEVVLRSDALPGDLRYALPYHRAR
jgi:hypothetical protein